MAKKNRPGFMVFHDDLQFVREMSDEEVGQLFKAMLRYSDSGEQPQFSPTTLKIGWAMVYPMIERDKLRYQTVCDNNSYSAYCKNADARGEVRMSKEAYLAQKHGEECVGVRTHTSGHEGMRFVPTPTPTTTSTSTATAIPAATAKQQGAGDLGKYTPYDEATFEKRRWERINMLPVC